jgi:predicted metal-dependent RNase
VDRLEEVKQEEKNILNMVKELVPKEAELTKVEFEGPDVAVYVKNVAAIYGNEQVIRSISTSRRS